MPTAIQYQTAKKKYAAYFQKSYRKNRAKVLERSRLYRLNHPDKVRALRLKFNFGISVEQYDEFLKTQNGVCALCLKPNENPKRRLAVDHDHVTGKIRGLLCGKCNKALGLINDSLVWLETAKEYLNG